MICSGQLFGDGLCIGYKNDKCTQTHTHMCTFLFFHDRCDGNNVYIYTYTNVRIRIRIHTRDTVLGSPAACCLQKIKHIYDSLCSIGGIKPAAHSLNCPPGSIFSTHPLPPLPVYPPDPPPPPPSSLPQLLCACRLTKEALTWVELGFFFHIKRLDRLYGPLTVIYSI